MSALERAIDIAREKRERAWASNRSRPGNPKVTQHNRTVVTVRLRRPTDIQQMVLDSKAKRIVIKGGRRGGKTVGAAILASKGFLSGRRVLYAAPTTEQVESFWYEVKRAFQEAIDQGVLKANETDHTLEYTHELTKTRIRAKTAWNADTLRGDYADLLILDEWQLMNEDAWEVVGAPMLLDNNGDAVFIFTPPSLKSRSVSKAKNPRHALDLYRRAKERMQTRPDRWLAVHFTSYQNPHISAEALAELTEDMTAVAIRQEIFAEDIDTAPGALWTRENIEKNRVSKAPTLVRIVVAIDPPAESKAKGSGAGIMVAGLGEDGHGYLLADGSLDNARPEEWGRAAIELYEEYKADRVVGETNNGGEMVEYVIRSILPDVSYHSVHASRGKAVRAEPVAAYSEKNRIHLVGSYPALEDEMCLWVPGDTSPHRLDAMVWAFTELMHRERTQIITWQQRVNISRY